MSHASRLDLVDRMLGERSLILMIALLTFQHRITVSGSKSVVGKGFK